MIPESTRTASRSRIRPSLETTPSAAHNGIDELLAQCERSVAACLSPDTDAAAALAEGRAIAAIVAHYDPEPSVLCAVLLQPLLAANLVSHDKAGETLPAAVVEQATALARLGSFELGAGALRGQSAQPRLPVAQAEGLRRMLLALVTDPRLVLARIAAQLHRLRGAKAAATEERRRLGEQTQALYAPLANRLGLGVLKWELEDFAFRYLEPDEYRRIAASLNERRADREAYIQKVRETLSTELAAAQLEATVEGRPKHIYSIWKKMTQKGLAFEQLYDVRAVRILVGSVADCYAALGVVHGLWPYIPGEFDDYIATPKANGYRSIHTAVHGPDGRTLEVQIRTLEMHERSELGVAAHWRYKEGTSRDLAYERKLERLRNLLAPARGAEDSSPDFLSSVTGSLFAERVYVFSPRGDVTELGAGATPLDFAYQLHTDLGHRCRGAKVNGRMVPLDHQLVNGDSVEIITGKQLSPSRDWLIESRGFLATRSARAKVRAFFRRQDEGTNRQAGREILERELAKVANGATVSMVELLAELDQPSVEQLTLLLGEGELSGAQIAGALDRLQRTQEQPPAIEPAVELDRTASGIQVMGVGDLLTTYARCCRPVPPEHISGYVTVGRGVTIHRSDCANLRRLQARNPARLIAVDWGSSPDRLYNAEFTVHATDRRGLVRDVSAVLADARLSIERMTTQTDPAGTTADMTLAVRVHSLEELERILARIRALPDVVSVRRR